MSVWGRGRRPACRPRRRGSGDPRQRDRGDGHPVAVGDEGRPETGRSKVWLSTKPLASSSSVATPASKRSGSRRRFAATRPSSESPATAGPGTARGRRRTPRSGRPRRPPRCRRGLGRGRRRGRPRSRRRRRRGPRGRETTRRRRRSRRRRPRGVGGDGREFVVGEGGGVDEQLRQAGAGRGGVDLQRGPPAAGAVEALAEGEPLDAGGVQHGERSLTGPSRLGGASRCRQALAEVDQGGGVGGEREDRGRGPRGGPEPIRASP